MNTKWKVSAALVIGVAVGVVSGWVLHTYVSTQLAAAASLLASDQAVQAFEACNVDQAIEFAVRAAVLDPKSSIAGPMLADFKKRKEARLKACANQK